MLRRWPPREELYGLVWAKPAEQVAADLGISGVALAKACARMNIPKPPRGYWAKRQAGQQVKRPPLPVSAQPKPKPARALPTFQPPPVTRMASGQPLIRETERAYAKAEMDVWGRLVVHDWTRTPLDLMVSRAALPRTLHVMALILEGLKRTRLTLHVKNGRTILDVDGDQLYLRLKEKVQSQPSLPILPSRFPSVFDVPTQQKAIGTGRLMLLTCSPDDGTYEVAWSDGKLTLEDQLPLILASFRRLPEVAQAKRDARRREEEARRAEQRRREEARQRAAALQAELNRREDETNACREVLHQQARRWEEVQRLQAYLAWLDQEQATKATQDGEEYQVWRAWASEEIWHTTQQHQASLQQLMGRVHDMKHWPANSGERCGPAPQRH